MQKLLAIFAALVAIVAVTVAAGPNFGSYVSLCRPGATQVMFRNYKLQNCQGPYTVFTKPIGGCHTELLIASWNASCNATTTQYFNYMGRSCQGSSVLTRTYTNNQCFNCPNKECKNP